jgi:hypothetical protein
MPAELSGLPKAYPPRESRTPQKSRKIRFAPVPATRSSWSRRALAHRWLVWIPPKLTWNNAKPVIRCAVAVGSSAVELITGLGWLVIPAHPRNSAYDGPSSLYVTICIADPVFVLVVAFMLPPIQPLVQTLEQYANLFAYCGLSWAWVGYCL